MKARLFPIIAILGLVSPGADLCAQEPPPPPPPALSPSTLFENLTKETKPLWRQQYRAHIERTVTDREKAALALGAVMTDLALAAMARDEQQIHNLEQDEEALEKLLGIPDKMRVPRQRYLACAQAGDWPSLTKTIDKAHERQIELLIGLRDAPLASLVTTGRWIRCWQICTSVVIAKQLPSETLAIGTSALVQETSAAATKLTQNTPKRYLHFLAHRLNALVKLWPTEEGVEGNRERLRATQEILDELVGQLVQDQPRALAPATVPVR